MHDASLKSASLSMTLVYRRTSRTTLSRCVKQHHTTKVQPKIAFATVHAQQRKQRHLACVHTPICTCLRKAHACFRDAACQQMTLDQIKLSELTVESAKARATEASRRLDAARLALRESVAAATHCDGVDEAPIAGIAVEIRDLDDVLVRDVGEKIKADGRWPLVIDPSGQASVFLRYLVSLQTRLRIFLLQDGAKAAGATCACEL
eukprot:365661-Chlamydomonas_euryale.AAC.20